MGAWRFRRRSWTVEGFQAQLVLTLVVWLAVWIFVFAVLLLGPLVFPTLTTWSTAQGPGQDAVLAFLHGRVWLPLAVLFAGLTIFIFRETHRVAGPLYRFRRVFAQIADGDVSMTVRIRSNDYLVQECEDLDQMVTSLRGRLNRAQAATAEVRSGLETLVQQVGPSQLPLVASLLAHSREADEAVGAFVTSRVTSVADDDPAPVQPRGAGIRHSDAGFSLVELMIASSILVVLTSLAVPAYQSALDSSRVARAIGDINAIGKDVEMYRATNYCYPASLQDINRSFLRDPWGAPYSYGVTQRPGGRGRGAGAGSCQACGGACIGIGAARKDKNLVPINGDFDLYSIGKDRNSAPPLTAGPSRDDVVRGRNGGFVGLARDY